MATLKNTSATSTKGGFQGGTYNWTAPELFPDPEKDIIPEATQASDIYSLGMVLWELASREIPYKKAGKMATILIMQGKKETFPTDTPAEFKAIVDDCWKVADKRPSALEVAKRLESLWENEVKLKEKKQKAVEKTEISKDEKKTSSSSSPVGKKLNDGSQFAPTQPTDIKTPKKPEEKEIVSIDCNPV